MQIAELPLYALISINFDAVDEHRPGALYGVLDIDTVVINAKQPN